MDEFENSGMGPEVKAYFKKIMNSFSAGLCWMMGVATAGLFFGLAIVKNVWKWYNLLFYFFAVVSLAALLYYLRKIWMKKSDLRGGI